jgi:CheY-like chemotaxis protein
MDDSKGTGFQKFKGDKLEKVGEYLRNIDKFIKNNQLDIALEEIDRAREIDPKNAYLTAFEYRIHSIKNPPKEEEKRPVEKEFKGIESQIKPPDLLTIEDVKPVSVKIEKDIELKYQKRFTEEMKKAEQRSVQIQKELEKKFSEERLTFLKQLEEEKKAFKKQIEDEYKETLEHEIHAIESDFQSKLTDQRKAIESGIRSQIEEEYKARVMDMQSALGQKSKELAAGEKQSVEEIKKKLETEYDTRLQKEIEKINQTLKDKTIEERQETENKFREKLQSELEGSLEKERGAIGAEYQNLKKQIEKSYVERFKQLNMEFEQQVKNRVNDAEKAMKENLDSEKIALQKKLEEKYNKDLQTKLEEEAKKADLQIQEALEKERSLRENERQQLLGKEHEKIEELRSSIKEEIHKEYTDRLESSMRDFEQNHQKTMQVVEFALPETKGERTKLYEGRIRAVLTQALLHAGGGQIQTSVADAQMLMEIKDLLGMSFEEHITCETRVRKQLFREQVEGLIVDGSLSPDDEPTISFLKQLFNFSPEEKIELDTEEKSESENVPAPFRIVVADDDESLLSLIEKILTEKGYQVITFNQIEKALAHIKLEPVDLILSDVRFPGDEFDGYEFFKRVQQNPHLLKVPFILMSSLDDGMFMKTGVQLGVDDYLTKPLDMELLLAVIEGKLKKYQMLRKEN